MKLQCILKGQESYANKLIKLELGIPLKYFNVQWTMLFHVQRSLIFVFASLNLISDSDWTPKRKVAQGRKKTICHSCRRIKFSGDMVRIVYKWLYVSSSFYMHLVLLMDLLTVYIISHSQFSISVDWFLQAFLQAVLLASQFYLFFGFSYLAWPRFSSALAFKLWCMVNTMIAVPIFPSRCKKFNWSIRCCIMLCLIPREVPSK